MAGMSTAIDIRAYACQQEPRTDVPVARLPGRQGLQLVAQSPQKTPRLPRRGVWAVSRAFQGIPQWSYLAPDWSVEPEDDPANSRVARSSVRQKEAPLRCAVASIDQVEIDMRTPWGHLKWMEQPIHFKCLFVG